MLDISKSHVKPSDYLIATVICALIFFPLASFAANTAQTKCFNQSGCTSVLEANTPREFILGDKKLKKAFFQLRSDILTQILADTSQASAAIINYDPTAFDNHAEINKTLHVDGKADRYGEAVSWRHRTKHRDITSEATCYGNGFGERVTPFPLVVTTGVGYNFMGSSPGDEYLYTVNGRLKDRAAYQNAMTLLFKRWLSALDNAQVEVAIIPMISGGVYVKKLTASERTVARNSIQAALAQAVEETPLQYLQEVIHVTPNTRENAVSGMYKTAITNFNQYQGTVALSVTNTDFFEAAETAHTAGYRVGMLNPGSDRTLGGHFMKFLTVPANGNYTLEEIIFNLTDVSKSQPIDASVTGLTYTPYPASLWHDTKTTMPCTANDIQSTSFPQQLAKHLQYRLLVDKVSIITDSRQGVKIYFKTRPQALRLADLLKSQSMPKQVNSSSRGFYLGLTQQELNQFQVCGT